MSAIRTKKARTPRRASALQIKKNDEKSLKINIDVQGIADDGESVKRHIVPALLNASDMIVSYAGELGEIAEAVALLFAELSELFADIFTCVLLGLWKTQARMTPGARLI